MSRRLGCSSSNLTRGGFACRVIEDSRTYSIASTSSIVLRWVNVRIFFQRRIPRAPTPPPGHRSLRLLIEPLRSFELGNVEKSQNQHACAQKRYSQTDEHGGDQVVAAGAETSARQGEDHHERHARCTHQLVDEKRPVSRHPHHWADTDGRTDVGCHQADDQRQEEQSAPHNGQGDQGQGKHQRDRVKNQHDPSTCSKVGFDDYSRPLELVEPSLDVEDHPYEKEAYQSGRDLGNEEEEDVSYRVHEEARWSGVCECRSELEEER